MNISSIRKSPDHVVYVQQVRKKKRSLHEANPRKWSKTKNRFAVRNSKNTKEVNGVCLFDRVEVPGKGYGWVTGFIIQPPVEMGDFLPGRVKEGKMRKEHEKVICRIRNRKHYVRWL